MKKWLLKITSWMLRFYWTPTLEEMRHVATYYGFKAETQSYPIYVMTPFYMGVEGYISFKRRTICVREDDLRVFWHEVGHIHGFQGLINLILNVLLLSIPTSIILRVIQLCDGVWIGVAVGAFFIALIANELIAHFVIGLPRSKYWKRRLRP